MIYKEFYSYKVFNLLINSYDLKIPELTPINKNTSCDIKIFPDNADNWPEIRNLKYDSKELKIGKDEIRLNIENVGTIRTYDRKFLNWYNNKNEINNNKLIPFILGSGMGSLLIQNNFLLLHGNALYKDGKAIICLGHSGYGKSSIAYLLMKKGWQLISDDLVVINENNFLLPGIPRIKLCFDMVNFLKLDSRKMTSIPYGDYFKYAFTNCNNTKLVGDLPLKSIYILSPWRDYISSNRVNAQEEISQKIKLLLLKNSIYRPTYVKYLMKEEYYFLHLAEIAKNIPMYLLNIPKGLTNLSNFINEVNF